MKRRLRFICLAFACLGASLCVCAQDRYQSDVLADMAKSLKLENRLDTLSDGAYEATFTYKKRPLRVEAREGRVCHIGYVLFTAAQRQAMPSPVYDFLERYVLAADLPMERQKSLSKQLAEDDLHFAKGEFSQLRDLTKEAGKWDLSIVNQNNKRYLLTWQRGNDIWCSVDFPISYDLLHGTEMVENERRIEEDLKRAFPSVRTPMSVTRQQLQNTWRPNYYVWPGASYYTDQLTSNRYYEQAADSTFHLIFNRRYPEESLANLLTTAELENVFQVQVRLIKYNFQEANFAIPLLQFVNYFLQQGCTPYYGVRNYTDTTLEAQLVMHNPAEGYCHTMKVTFDVEQLVDKKGTIAVRLNSFIPTSKIKNLFDELKL